MEIVDTGIVYENPKPYLRSQHAFHPTLVNLGGKEWLCAYDLSVAVEGMDYGTYRSRSRDDGRTWQFEGPIAAARKRPPMTYTVRINRLADGLVGFGAQMHRENPEEGFANRANMGWAPMDLILVRSKDNGKTWGRPRIIRPPLVGPGFEICHTIVELPDGRWLAPAGTLPDWNGNLPNGHKTLVLISDDRGKSWPEYGVAFDGTAKGLGHWEVSVVPLGGEKVLAMAWAYHIASGRSRPNRFAVSDDGGRHFGPSGKIGIDGQTCKGLRLRDGRIFLVYRRTDKPGLWATLADFDGVKTWNLLKTTPLWGAALTTSGMNAPGINELSALKFGFPQPRQMDNGDVLLVFWCFEDWCTKIRWIRLAV